MINQLIEHLRKYNDKIEFRITNCFSGFFTESFNSNLTDEIFAQIVKLSSNFQVIRKDNLIFFYPIKHDFQLNITSRFKNIYYPEDFPNLLCEKRIIATVNEYESISKSFKLNTKFIQIKIDKLTSLKIDFNDDLILIPAIYQRNDFRQFYLNNSSLKISTWTKAYYSPECEVYNDTKSERMLLASEIKATDLDLVGCNYNCSDNLIWLSENISNRVSKLNKTNDSDYELIKKINLAQVAVQSFVNGNTQEFYSYLKHILELIQFKLNSPEFRINNYNNISGGYLVDYWCIFKNHLKNYI